ncbi:MAG: hypothetical protein V1811_03290 [Candidatus Micrarchaeota archaeon]
MYNAKISALSKLRKKPLLVIISPRGKNELTRADERLYITAVEALGIGNVRRVHRSFTRKDAAIIGKKLARGYRTRFMGEYRSLCTLEEMCKAAYVLGIKPNQFPKRVSMDFTHAINPYTEPLIELLPHPQKLRERFQSELQYRKLAPGIYHSCYKEYHQTRKTGGKYREVIDNIMSKLRESENPLERWFVQYEYDGF